MPGDGALRFDGRVAIVTGAGGGLGREHALCLAGRGAQVVVNDIGGAVDGTGSDPGAAAAVVDEIVGCGGVAIADTNSVTSRAGAEAMVAAALDTWGRVDILVNNAGILRDKTFAKMDPNDMSAVLDVHLLGAMYVTQAAWVTMREARYGRVISTSSAAGIFGNFGQANYGAAKAGIVGLSNVLAIEGANVGIRSNVIAPVARTRMTEQVLGSLAERVSPGLVSPLVAWLAHESCQVTGRVYTVGGGRAARLFVGMTSGWTRTDGHLDVEDIRDHFDEIDSTEQFSIPNGIQDDFRALAHALRS